jgi:hypothetical protein
VSSAGVGAGSLADCSVAGGDGVSAECASAAGSGLADRESAGSAACRADCGAAGSSAGLCVLARDDSPASNSRAASMMEGCPGPSATWGRIRSTPDSTIACIAIEIAVARPVRRSTVAALPRAALFGSLRSSLP